jgi:sodium-dependent phosphate transporter
MIPIYFGITFGILTMMIVWKGAPALGLDKLSNGAIIGAVLGVMGVVVIICVVFFIPYFRRRLIMEDWTIRWYHLFLGPALLYRGPVPPRPEGFTSDVVIDFYEGRITRDDIRRASMASAVPVDPDMETAKGKPGTDSPPTRDNGNNGTVPKQISMELQNADKPPFKYRLWIFLKKTILRGLFVDVIAEQSKVQESSPLQRFLTKDIQTMHSKAAKYDNKTEYLYSMLQVFTATTASFAHGSNDVANAVGPLTAIYQIWSTGTNAARLPVPVWVLVYGGGALVLGFVIYGYNLLKALGNRLTLMSPSRGFCMELGAALTVVLASRLAIPISTTQCIVGAIMAVGLCNGDLKAINWRMVAWCYFGWAITLVLTGTVAGVLTAIILYAPRPL